LVSCRNGKILVYITFHRDVEPIAFKTVMGIDINFNNITYTVIDLSGNLITIGVIPFKGLKRALHLKKLSEELQKRYSNSWRFLKWVRGVRGRWLNRARNILVDSAHRASKRLVDIAKEHRALIVFEDLEKLKENSNNGYKLSWENPCGATREYRCLQSIKLLFTELKQFM
jgi:putative transposase